VTTDDAVSRIQIAYPQVYLACHTRHQRKRSTRHNLSQRDSSILAHLHPTQGIAPAVLAAHLGIVRSTMSEALKRLIALGFVQRASARGAAVILSEQGISAMRDTSVLETARLARVLSALSARDRQLICDGLERLARACRRVRTVADGEDAS
jgi:DNA-binding MarR family transcriptional regulator